MSTAGLWDMNPASSRRFSLLSSKSLGNLHGGPAHSVAAQKSARRAQRVLAGPGGLITISAAIPASRGRTEVEVDHGRDEDEAHDDGGLVVSFQDAANMFIESNSGILSDTARKFSINPRKSRRLATDFGLSHDSGQIPPEPPLTRINTSSNALGERTPTMSSPGSTPLSLSDAYTVSDTSSLQGLVGFASEFPQPPSLSPALRRMQSVPWLKNDGSSSMTSSATDPLLPFGRSHYRLAEKSNSADTPFPYRTDDIQTLQSDDTSSYGSSALSQRARLRTRGMDFEMVGEGLIELEMNSPRSRPERDFGQTRTVNTASWARRSNRKTWTTDDLLQWSISHRTHESIDISEYSSVAASLRHDTRRPPKAHNDNRRYTMCARPEEAIIEKPMIIRKVASMQGKAKDSDKIGQRPIQKIKSLRLFPSSSKQDVPQSSREGKQRGWLFSRSSHHQGAASMDYGKDRTYRPNRTPYPSMSMQDVVSANRRPLKSKASMAHNRDSKVWLSGLGLSNYDFPTTESRSGSRPKTSAGENYVPHYQTRLSAAKTRGNLSETFDTSTSFINITHEKTKGENQGERKTRVQKLIARASTGIMEWGRNLTGRRHPRSP